MTLPKRTERALAGMNVVKVGAGLFMVQSQSSDSWYNVEVELGRATCDCPDAEHRDVVCKHARAAALQDARGEVKEI